MAAKSTKKRKSTKSRPNKKQQDNGLRSEIIILASLAVCILLVLSNFGVGGIVGEAVSSVFFGLFGIMAYVLPFVFFALTAFQISNRGNTHAHVKIVSAVVLFILLTAFFELIFNSYTPGASLLFYYREAAEHRNAGGLTGGCLASILCPMIGVAGTYVVLVIFSVICLILVTEKSLLAPLGKKGRSAFEDVKKRRAETAVVRARRREEKRREIPDPVPEKSAPVRRTRKVSGVSFATTLGEEKKSGRKSPDIYELKPEKVSAEKIPDKIVPDEKEEQPFVINRAEPSPAEEKPAEAAAAEEKPKRRNKAKEAEIVSAETENVAAEAQKQEQQLEKQSAYRTPNASCGPSVTRYELQPDQGVKVSRIVGLADDIKLNLAVADLRIEAPIPGKAAVGIEVPNQENTAVMLRDLLESPEFEKSASPITFAVGKDIAGKTVVADIAKMPHLLVAGSTGSGKSVCINTLIMSIIYKSDPDEVKLILVDPKVVELSVYNGIPHLMIPVVTDPKKAAGALNWAVAEMEKRYKLFAEYNVRDLKGFNAKVERGETGEEVKKKLPQIVIIIDELADLMMVAPGEVEGAICRLAQLARAAGLHLVLATQRPSVNVITGLIKANMPSRIAFAVSSGVDSRTIIDMNGAEKLLGKGDMLFYPSGYPKPVRVQGSFVSDKEVQDVVEFLLKNNAGTTYNNELEEHMNSNTVLADPGASSDGGDDRDTYFADAGKLIIDKDKASIGMLQRMFKIGFNRAARIMDQLAEAGVVGPEEGTKPRKVLMTAEEFEEYMSNSRS